MGLMDILGSLLGGKGGSILEQLEGNALTAVLNQVLGSGEGGGLNAIVNKLQEGGLGDQVKSWLGNGENLPISGEQIKAALGNEQVEAIASKLGIPLDTVLNTVAGILPGIIDKASPNGSLSDEA